MLACAGWELQNILTAFPFREPSPKSLNLAVYDVLPFSAMDLFQSPAGPSRARTHSEWLL